MNRKELVAAVADGAGLNLATADAAVEAALGAVVAELGAGRTVSLPGFGTFEVRERAAREGRNPQTGESMHIAATRVPVFKAAQALRRAVVK
jgi:DNA-binding protein HU-beta